MSAYRNAASTSENQAVDPVDTLPVDRHESPLRYRSNEVFRSPIWRTAQQPNLWRTIQLGWKTISKLRAELLCIDSESKRAWEEIWRPKAACHDACDELTLMLDSFASGQVLSQSTIDRLRGFGTSIRSSSAQATLMRRDVQRLQERRADVEFRISEQESMIFEQLERLLGPLPDAPSMKPNPSVDNEEAESSVDLPHPLKKYYEAVGWVGVLRERLDDLRYDHMESQEARRPSFRMSRSLSSNGSSDLRFQRQEAELEEQIERAQREVDGWERQCRTDQIEIAIRPASSRVSSAPSPGCRDQDMMDDESSPQNLEHSLSLARALESDQNYLSRSRLQKTELTRSRQPAISKTVSFVQKWMHNIWGQSCGRTSDRTNRDESEESICMRSTHSLPEYVMVDRVFQDWRTSGESERDTQVEMMQKQAELGMSMRRRFAHRRPYHSDSSLLPDPAGSQSNQSRRATCHEIGRRTQLALQHGNGDHVALEAAFQEIASISPI